MRLCTRMWRNRPKGRDQTLGKTAQTKRDTSRFCQNRGFQVRLHPSGDKKTLRVFYFRHSFYTRPLFLKLHYTAATMRALRWPFCKIVPGGAAVAASRTTGWPSVCLEINSLRSAINQEEEETGRERKERRVRRTLFLSDVLYLALRRLSSKK